MTTRDTTREARRAQVEALRRLGAEGRLRQAFELSEFVRDMSVQGRLARRSDESVERARADMLRRVLGEALYEAAYGRLDPVG